MLIRFVRLFAVFLLRLFHFCLLHLFTYFLLPHKMVKQSCTYLFLKHRERMIDACKRSPDAELRKRRTVVSDSVIGTLLKARRPTLSAQRRLLHSGRFHLRTLHPENLAEIRRALKAHGGNYTRDGVRSRRDKRTVVVSP